MDYYKCHECMKDAPYMFCCKCYCGEYEFCRYCKAGSRGTKCPNSELLRSETNAHDEQAANKQCL